jgi:hypothetical protein
MVPFGTSSKGKNYGRARLNLTRHQPITMVWAARNINLMEFSKPGLTDYSVIFFERRGL